MQPVRFKRITLDGMKWWVPCFPSVADYSRCFTRERARAFESGAYIKAQNPEVL